MEIVRYNLTTWTTHTVRIATNTPPLQANVDNTKYTEQAKDNTNSQPWQLTVMNMYNNQYKVTYKCDPHNTRKAQRLDIYF